MRKLKLDGVEVVTSFLSQRPFRAAPCELLLDVRPGNKAAALATFKKTGPLGTFSGLRISGIDDLSFLKDFPLLLYLEIVDTKRVNTRHLDCLENLRGLRLESPGAELDFACFPELEVFSGDWHVDNRNLAKSRELRRLDLWHFKPHSLDLTVLADMIRLEDLAIYQTDIVSLSGLETLEDLRRLDVGYAPKLESLTALETRDSEIRELSLDKAKNVGSYKPIVSARRLRRLKLSSCARMENLKWLAGLNHLDIFTFVDTNVVDGDLSPLLDLPALRYVGTMDKKHYNYRCDALNELLDQRLARH